MTTERVKVVETQDGSSTLYSNLHNTLFHSSFGAITESKHIYIGAGLQAINQQKINILEVGFGTGLNAALSFAYAKEHSIELAYHAIDLYPLTANELEQLNYMQQLNTQSAQLWQLVCTAPWERVVQIAHNLQLYKMQLDFTKWVPHYKYHVVYFDAFAPNDQPEMWAPELFQIIFDTMHPGGVLTTYCVKGAVKRNLKAAGFRIVRLAGPPGKRQILRAWKE